MESNPINWASSYRVKCLSDCCHRNDLGQKITIQLLKFIKFAEYWIFELLLTHYCTRLTFDDQYKLINSQMHMRCIVVVATDAAAALDAVSVSDIKQPYRFKYHKFDETIDHFVSKIKIEYIRRTSSLATICIYIAKIVSCNGSIHKNKWNGFSVVRLTFEYRIFKLKTWNEM